MDKRCAKTIQKPKQRIKPQSKDLRHEKRPMELAHRRVSLCCPGWYAVLESCSVTILECSGTILAHYTSASRVQAISLPQPPERSLALFARLECSGAILVTATSVSWIQ
ncbi:hypothetical protein AAY473_036434, partial [Plecturocebus cupreus]